MKEWEVFIGKGMKQQITYLKYKKLYNKQDNLLIKLKILSTKE